MQKIDNLQFQLSQVHDLAILHAAEPVRDSMETRKED
jgi:hypothetical protein